SPDGRHVATACADGLVRVWDIVTPEAGDLEMLALLAEAVVGQRWDPKTARIAPLASAEVFERLGRLRTMSAPGERDTDGKRLVRWFMDDRSHRTLSPFSTITAPQARDQLSALDPGLRAK